MHIRRQISVDDTNSTQQSLFLSPSVLCVEKSLVSGGDSSPAKAPHPRSVSEAPDSASPIPRTRMRAFHGGGGGGEAGGGGAWQGQLEQCSNKEVHALETVHVHACVSVGWLVGWLLCPLNARLNIRRVARGSLL